MALELTPLKEGEHVVTRNGKKVLERVQVQQREKTDLVEQRDRVKTRLDILNAQIAKM